MKKLFIGLLAVGSLSAYCAPSDSTSSTEVSKTAIKKYGLSLGNFTMQSPNAKSGTDKMYGMSITGEREFDLNKNGLTTSTNLTYGFATNDDKYTDVDGTYTDKYSSTNELRALSLVQSLNKRFETRAGVLRANIGLGLNRLNMDSSSRSTFTDSADPTNNFSDKFSGEYTTIGRTLAFGADLEFKNRITAFLAYQTTNYDSSKFKYKATDGAGDTVKGSIKIDAFSLQTLTLGMGYRF